MAFYNQLKRSCQTKNTFYKKPPTHLPPETWQHIIGFIKNKRDLKNICLVSKGFRDIALPFLWHSPKLTSFDIGDFEWICRKPIRELILHSLRPRRNKKRGAKRKRPLNDEEEEAYQQLQVRDALDLFKMIGSMTSLTLLSLNGYHSNHLVGMLLKKGEHRAFMELSNLSELWAFSFWYSGTLNPESSATISNLLTHFTNLQEFGVLFSTMSAPFYERLSKIDSLRSIGMRGISEDDCSHLAKMDNLERVQINQDFNLQDQAVQSAIKRLKLALPKCRIICKKLQYYYL